MDSSQRALQTNGKLFFKFSINFRISGQKPIFFFKRIVGNNIDQSAMCYKSMVSSLQALQTDVKLFSNPGFIFQISYTFLE